ncbi:hypothetical protein EYF80_015302 [Liparis tanakae]|uniref:Uncharacterized protein n=1 Tax=Liparis tanakae TaxID=230148 RepID=A0A4Z2IAV4_9TELE|nr:hypothetical protein EYF80_015302 [Liparis tanakae]
MKARCYSSYVKELKTSLTSVFFNYIMKVLHNQATQHPREAAIRSRADPLVPGSIAWPVGQAGLYPGYSCSPEEPLAEPGGPQLPSTFSPISSHDSKGQITTLRCQIVVQNPLRSSEDRDVIGALEHRPTEYQAGDSSMLTQRDRIITFLHWQAVSSSGVVSFSVTRRQAWRGCNKTCGQQHGQGEMRRDEAG